MLALGYGFLVLGVLGLFLPFLQGFLFLLVGLLILARHATGRNGALDRLKRIHPKAGELIDKAEVISTAGRKSSAIGARTYGAA